MGIASILNRPTSNFHLVAWRWLKPAKPAESGHGVHRLLIVGLVMILIQGHAMAASVNRTALVIGNSAYESRLPNPERDAQAVADKLRNMGFEVILKTNANYEGMLEALDQFSERLTQRQGLGLFYYAGHGIQSGDENFLIPIGVKLEKELHLKSRSLSFHSVLDHMAVTPNGVTIAILDACRDNPLTRSWKSTPRGGLAPPKDTPNGSLVIYSTAAGQTAEDGDGQNSPFTSALLAHLSDPVPIGTMFQLVGSRVVQASEGKQRPNLVSSLYEPIVLATGTVGGGSVVNPVPPPVPPPGPVAGQTWTNSLGMEFVTIPAGRFRMGDLSGKGESNEKPVHEVHIRQPFAMMTTEVTVGYFKRFVGATGYLTEAEKGGGCYVWTGEKWDYQADKSWRNPGFTQNDKQPVVCVSWNDAAKMIDWLNRDGEGGYRLPSEAEWEYAARAGTTTEFAFGNQITTDQANFDGNGTFNGSPKGSYRQKTLAVKSFEPNAWGLYDMHGNVWEWTQDCYSDSYNGAPNDGSANTRGDCDFRVLRGGSWDNLPAFLRAADRGRSSASNRYNALGFRLVQGR